MMSLFSVSMNENLSHGEFVEISNQIMENKSKLCDMLVANTEQIMKERGKRDALSYFTQCLHLIFV